MQQQPPPTQKKSTNTVILVVVIVLGAFCFLAVIMAAILFPVFSQAKLAAQRSATITEAKQIALALNMYAAENDDRLPTALATTDDLRKVVDAYVPSAGVDCTSNNPDGGEFVPNKGVAGLKIIRVVSPESAILVYETMPWKKDGGRVAAMFDTSVKYIPHFDEATMLHFTYEADNAPQAER